MRDALRAESPDQQSGERAWQLRKLIPYERTTGQERERFDQFRQNGNQTPDDRELLEKVVKEQVNLLTDPDEAEAIGRRRAAIERCLETGHPQFLADYKALLKKQLPPLLENHLHVRVNAMMLLAKLRDETLVDVFDRAIRNPAQHEAVQYWAVKGILFMVEKPGLFSDLKYKAKAIEALQHLAGKKPPVHVHIQQLIVHIFELLSGHADAGVPGVETIVANPTDPTMTSETIRQWADLLSEAGVKQVRLPKQFSDAEWGAEKDGLRTRLVLLTEKLAIGQPLRFRVEVKNVGSVARPYNNVPVSLNLMLQVRGAEGHPVLFIGPIVSGGVGSGGIGGSGTQKTIMPNETVALFDKLDIAEQFRLEQPGRYTVQYVESLVAREIFPPSNTVTVELKPKLAQPSEGWGSEQDGLRTRLVLLTENPAIGQPLKFRLEMKNFGKVERHYDPQVAAPFRVITVKKENGDAEPYIGPTYQTAGGPKPIKPGEAVALWDDFDMAENFLLAEPGKYVVHSVVAKVRPLPPLPGAREPAQSSIPPSNDVTVEVQPGKPPELKAMFLRMREILPEGKAWRISLSGSVIFFTYSPTNLKKDVTTIQLWFTKEKLPADFKRGDGENRQVVDDLGETRLGHANLGAPSKAGTLWPDYREKIRSRLDAQPTTGRSGILESTLRLRLVPTVDGTGLTFEQLTINGRSVRTLEDLERELQQLGRNVTNDLEVIIEADKSLQYKLVLEVVQTVGKFGCKRINFAGRPSEFESARKKLDHRLPPGPPAGTVVRIDPQNRQAYVDLGEADRLLLRTTFSVWSPAAFAGPGPGERGEIDKRGGAVKAPRDKGGQRQGSGPKAYLEIIAILGPHLSTGRITLEDLTNPLVPGDKVDSPLWRPGQPAHLALAGRFQLTDKGGNERDRLAETIRKQGGVIDAELNDDGTVVGEITVETDFLVLGSLPDPADAGWPDAQLAHQVNAAAAKLKAQAKRLGVEIIDQAKLYELMGLRQESANAVIYKFGRGLPGPDDKEPPRQERWEIVLSKDMSEKEYAQWLDFLNIQLAVQLDNGLKVASKFTAEKPARSEQQFESFEKRMYFRWSDGNARQADIDLLRKAGIAATDRDVVMLFVPFETEQLLARLELKHTQADDRAFKDGKLRMELVRRTRFTVKKQGNGYAFEVTEQELFGDPTDKPKEEGLE